MKKGSADNLLIASLYVDDLRFTGNSAKIFNEFKASKEYFNMSDLGKLNYFLGVEV